MPSGRTRNRRGEGARLRDEILDAARALIEDSGEPAVSLRSVARQVGIAAPSIYAHFPDREAIISALVDEAFDELSATVTTATDAATDPVAKLRAACAAYMEFAMRRPNRYQLAFAARASNSIPRDSATHAFTLLVNALAACVEAGASASTDPFADATAIWVAMHGYAVLYPSRPAFPWPDTDATLERIVTALAGLDQPGATPPRERSTP
jgi:AcrR family transcriptional regulator